jgi:uncharacterized coiled-coil protein SlyX
VSGIPADFVSIIERLARQEVHVEEVRKDVAEVRNDVHQGFDKLDSRFGALELRIAATEDAVRTAKIGWRLLMTIGSLVLALAGTAGALAAKWLHVAGGFPK